MADSQGVWGIEIGQAGLKAIRLRYAAAAGQAVAVAFDYVPHAKILSQPDAIPEELVPQALETFLSRNDVKGDKLAISVPGQAALARFIKLPPVEAGKVTEIVRYEARQQIPFPLEEVIWDFQNLGAAEEEGGFMLEAEVGLFAMKRDQVLHHLRPYINANVEVELIQIAPLALYNFLSYDQLGVRPDEEFQAEDDHCIVVDMGADNTTLLISNGEKIWMRNVPIGGNHFTRALTKEMKLTFAKAEHLKCNATKSPDPRAVFQALRPVFNDYVSEVQRSVGYFSSVNRDAKIKKILGVGNGFKLAGLQKFLQQHLQYPVEKVEKFKALVGDNVLNAPLFQENVMGFAVPYGLALQALDRTRIHTSLLPPEIVKARMIRRKKPWAVATAATLLFALGASVAGGSVALNSVAAERWNAATSKTSSLKTSVQNKETAYSEAKDQHAKTAGMQDLLLRPAEHRDDWLLLYRAINDSLPRDVGNQRDQGELDITKRRNLNIRSITSEKFDELGTWLSGRRLQGFQIHNMDDFDETYLPSGPGYVIRVEGTHYYNPDAETETDRVPGSGQNPRQGAVRLAAGGGGDMLKHVEDTLQKNLQAWAIGEGASRTPVRMLGISHAVFIEAPFPERIRIPTDKPAVEKPQIPFDLPELQPRVGTRRPLNPGEPETQQDLLNANTRLIWHAPFKIEFVWRPTTHRQRIVFDALHRIMPGSKLPESTGAQPAAAQPAAGQPAAVQVMIGPDGRPMQPPPPPITPSKTFEEARREVAELNLLPEEYRPLRQEDYDEYVKRYVSPPPPPGPILGGR